MLRSHLDNLTALRARCPVPSRTQHRQLTVLAFAILASAVAASAGAKPPRQHYANSSVQLDLAIPGATVCMIRPASQRIATSCKGFAPDAIAAALPTGAEMAALVQEGPPAARRVWMLAAMVQSRGSGTQMVRRS